MNKRIIGVCFGLIAASFAIAAETGENAAARITLTVTQFRQLNETTVGTRWTDATTSLAAHPSVTMSGQPELAILHVKRAVDLAITVVSGNAGESYRPVAIIFQQKPASDGTLADPDGRRNFSAAVVSDSTLTVRNRFDLRGVRYEFFVVIQRVSDGAIGIIDPEIENSSSD